MANVSQRAWHESHDASCGRPRRLRTVNEAGAQSILQSLSLKHCTTAASIMGHCHSPTRPLPFNSFPFAPQGARYPAGLVPHRQTAYGTGCDCCALGVAASESESDRSTKSRVYR